MITVIDLKNQTQCRDVLVLECQPPLSVSSIAEANQDHYGAYEPDKALEQIADALST